MKNNSKWAIGLVALAFVAFSLNAGTVFAKEKAKDVQKESLEEPIGLTEEASETAAAAVKDAKADKKAAPAAQSAFGSFGSKSQGPTGTVYNPPKVETAPEGFKPPSDGALNASKMVYNAPRVENLPQGFNPPGYKPGAALPSPASDSKIQDLKNKRDDLVKKGATDEEVEEVENQLVNLEKMKKESAKEETAEEDEE